MEQLRPRGQNIPSCSRDNVSLLKHALAAQKHFFLLPLDATAGEIKGDGAPGGTWGGGKVAVPKPPLGASAAKTRPRRSPRRGNAADASDAAEGGALRPRVLPLKRRDVNPVPCTAHPGGAFSAPSPQAGWGGDGSCCCGLRTKRQRAGLLSAVCSARSGGRRKALPLRFLTKGDEKRQKKKKDAWRLVAIPSAGPSLKAAGQTSSCERGAAGAPECSSAPPALLHSPHRSRAPPGSADREGAAGRRSGLPPHRHRGPGTGGPCWVCGPTPRSRGLESRPVSGPGWGLRPNPPGIPSCPHTRLHPHRTLCPPRGYQNNTTPPPRPFRCRTHRCGAKQRAAEDHRCSMEPFWAS